MNTERDQYLTEAIGECWHNIPTYFHSLSLNNTTNCTKCTRVINKESNNDFSTWNGFGKLWEWATQQKWWQHFLMENGVLAISGTKSNSLKKLVDPDTFANAIYSYLNGMVTQ